MPLPAKLHHALTLTLVNAECDVKRNFCVGSADSLHPREGREFEKGNSRGEEEMLLPETPRNQDTPFHAARIIGVGREGFP